MILATVGTQLPFPRLLEALDHIAGLHSLEIFAQTADPSWRAVNLQTTPHLKPEEFTARATRATLLVGHAGVGTLLTAKTLGKPLVMLPRRAELGEHRNDHQLATARSLKGVQGCYVAWDEQDLEGLVLEPGLEPATMERSDRRQTLIEQLILFIRQ